MDSSTVKQKSKGSFFVSYSLGVGSFGFRFVANDFGTADDAPIGFNVKAEVGFRILFDIEEPLVYTVLKAHELYSSHHLVLTFQGFVYVPLHWIL